MSAPGGRPSIVLIGFMGAGKSTAARQIAHELGVAALDSDAELVAGLGSPIADFFAAHGEAEFRRREEAVVLELLARRPEVLALGGGAVLSERVRAALAEHTVVLLEVDPATAWTRAHGAQRPLAQDPEEFAARFAERAPVYESLADAVVMAGRQDRVRRALPALLALEPRAGAAGGARTGPELVWAVAASGEYPVHVRDGLLAEPPWPDPAARRFLLTDETVARLHPLPAEHVLAIAPGETSKTLLTAERAWRALARAGATRADAVVALGGGVVGDLAGFVAATYQRGMPVVHVPTTLVAQVDSAYGGKTGVDLPEGKNYVGAYHQPAAVLADPGVLGTLPDAERAAGYAEVVKTALIAGGALWERVRAGEPVDAATILGCARAKLAIVAQDERDAGRRQVLNLGHTVGHAIETVTGYSRYRHGEAVALGLLAALRLAGGDGLRAEVRELLAGAGLPTRLDPAVDVEAVCAATARDKKRLGSGPTPFVLLAAPGDARPGCEVAPGELRAAVAELGA